MTPERLKKVEEIYHAALEISPPDRESFLQRICGEDAELLREVSSLLSFADSSGSVIDQSPKSLFARLFVEREHSLSIGKQINQYKITSFLGEGGMGAVFLARDTKLERNVAIKFLSEKFNDDSQGLTRFFVEAKSASALNHPNIITVYEIGEFENNPFIVTEFIDGITLKEYLGDEKLKLSEILDIAVQICSALTTAHQAGIVHRDIKPDNVMIRRDGIVKVLDFGLAKISQSSSEIDSEANTREKFSTIQGMILGTPNYMSPEQTRGKKIDTRTDIWSFGVLLYQMLTRKLPFQGETTSDIIAAILRAEPPPLTQFVTDISPELEKITLKSLRKRRSERYQTIDELLSELKNFRRELEFGTKTERLKLRISDQIENEKDTDAVITQLTAKASDFYPSKISSIFSQTVSTAKIHPISSVLILVTIVSILLASVLGVSRLFSPINRIDSFSKMNLAKLTFDGTATNIVSVSPDGKYFVYVLRDEGKETLVLRQTETSSVVQLVPSASVDYVGITFAPGGNYIYYTVFENRVGSLYEIPVLGGTPRKIADEVGSKVTFAPDGKMMAFVRSDTSLMVADAKGGSQRLLATSAQGEFWRLVEWNPDGKTILSSVYSSSETGLHLSEVSLKDGAEKRLSGLRWLGINGLSWLADGSGIIFTGRDTETKFSQFWFVPYPTGEPHRITNDFSTYLGLSLTVDNKSVVAIKEERLYNIWVSPDEHLKSAKKITVEEGRDEGTAGIVWTPDGKIVYTVRTTGTNDIWIVNADGSGNRQLTVDQGSNYSPIVSPDGKSIIFTSNRTGNQNLWRMDLDGSNQIALTDTPENEGNPSLTPDGKWIIYQRTNGNNLTAIWKLGINGGNPVQLTEIESNRPTVSPDGKTFACDYGEAKPGNPKKIAIFPLEGGKPLQILDLPLVVKSRIFRWTADGKALVYIDNSNRTSNLWNQTLDNNPPTQMTFFESGQIARFSLDSNGKGLALSRGNESSDVVMFSNFK